MFVCLCHALSDSDIRAAIEAGHDNVEAVIQHTKATSQCGNCLNDVLDLLSTHQTEQQTSAAETATALATTNT